MKPQSSQRLSPEFTAWNKGWRTFFDLTDTARPLGSIVRIVDGKLVRVAHVFSHHPLEYLRQ